MYHSEHITSDGPIDGMFRGESDDGIGKRNGDTKSKNDHHIIISLVLSNRFSPFLDDVRSVTAVILMLKYRRASDGQWPLVLSHHVLTMAQPGGRGGVSPLYVIPCGPIVDPGTVKHCVL